MKTFVAFGLATALHASEVRADDAIDPRAQALLDRARSVVVAAKTIEAHITHVELLGGPGFKMETESTVDLAAQRPDKFDIVARIGDWHGRLVSDGAQLFTLSRDRYTQRPAPPRIHDITDIFEDDVPIMPREGLIIMSLLFADRFPDDFAKLSALSIVGDEEIDGLPVTRLRLTLDPTTNPPADKNAPKSDPFVLSPDLSRMVLDVWIDRSERPLIHKLHSDFTPFIQGSSKPAEGDSFQFTMGIKGWKLDEPIAPERFTFTPPDGSREVVLHISPGSQWPLVGNPPAAMDLPLIDGGRFNPADHKGKIMVIVCWRLAQAAELYWLTNVLKAAAEFADQGVLLYTINVGDSEESIRAFLAERGWMAPVALGSYETVPKGIAVSSVPYILIVGQDGIVQGMHYMAYRNTASRVKAQLRWLLRGKSLLEDDVARPATRPQP